MKYITLVLIFSFSFAFSQKSKDKISDSNFNLDSLPKAILKELNRYRKEKGLDSIQMSDMLQEAGDISAGKMADSGKDKVDPKKTKKYLKKVGATKRGEELSNKAPMSKGKENYKTEEVAKNIYNRWESNPKSIATLLNPKYTLVGIACVADENSKKVYVSAIFGGYDITNGGAPYRDQLAVPYNKKTKKMDGPDLRKCKTCERWRNYDNLHKGLFVHDGKIYLKYHNSRELRRLLKKSTDGFAVDVVQRSQYIPADYNIVDNNLYNKGVMTNVIYKDKFFKKNILLKVFCHQL